MVWNPNLINETPIRPQSSFLQADKNTAFNDIMEEFRNNGIDYPYEAEEDMLYINGLSGLGPARKYLKQRSCPEIGNIYSSKVNYENLSPLSFDSGFVQSNSPNQREFCLPKQTSFGTRTNESWAPISPDELHQKDYFLDSVQPCQSPVNVQQNLLTEEQFEILSTIPSKALYFFINYYRKTVQKNKPMKEKICRFCKNNGERESVYRSHRLRTEGKLSCPVLRHLVCERCGATGDDAHTIKYCTRITAEERRHYELLMQGRRATKVTRPCHRPLSGQFDDFNNETSQYFAQEGIDNQNYQLSSQWMELERKLAAIQL